ncbi:MAG: AMP-dependent synthetase/ligase [Candidatus Kapaibacterium sp.]
MDFSTIPEMFYRLCDTYSGTKHRALIHKTDEEWKHLTHDELCRRVECFALGLLELGVKPGDRIGIVSENRIEWIISDLAITCLGAIDVPLFPTLTAKQEEFIFQDCKASYIIVSNNFQLRKVLEFKERLDGLRHVIVMNDKFETEDLSVRSMSGLIRRGEECRPAGERHKIVRKYAENVKPEDLLTLIYTSGTTGEPKGVMLTHRNVASNIQSLQSEIHFDEKDTFLSFLPLNHSYERTTGYYTAFASGSSIALAESPESVPAAIQDIQPTMMTTVPRLLEMMKRKIYMNISQEPASKQKMFNWAIEIGKEYVDRNLKGRVPMVLKTKYKLADKLVFRKIRNKIDPNLRMFVSGGAPLPVEVGRFFFAIGITVLEGYGLTEASPVVTLNRPDNIELGSIGLALNGVEVKLAEDGELLARGPNIMKGYWKDPIATQEVIDSEGWLHTGDIVQLTERRNIKITDRKKHIFVNSGGKNIAPLPIENMLAESRYIDQVFLVGDSREYCTALIIPDFDQLRMLAERTGIAWEGDTDLTSNRDIIYKIHQDIDALQKDLAKFERVRRFTLLDKPFTVEKGELSPKMSVKRHIVEEKYKELIDSMYGKK